MTWGFIFVLLGAFQFLLAWNAARDNKVILTKGKLYKGKLIYKAVGSRGAGRNHWEILLKLLVEFENEKGETLNGVIYTRNWFNWFLSKKERIDLLVYGGELYYKKELGQKAEMAYGLILVAAGLFFLGYGSLKF